MLELTDRIKKAMKANRSFMAYADKKVYIWLNPRFGNVDKRKLFRFAKALANVNRKVPIEMVYFKSSIAGEFGSSNLLKNEIYINLAYGKTITGIIYTLLHEYSHIDTRQGHTGIWKAKLQSFYPKTNLSSGEIHGIPLPDFLDRIHKVKRIVYLNDV